MSQPERFEILVLGSGAGGKLLAWHMARAGRRTAVVERRYIGGSCPDLHFMPPQKQNLGAEGPPLLPPAAPVRTSLTRSTPRGQGNVRQRQRGQGAARG